jgi:hypothetical protein
MEVIEFTDGRQVASVSTKAEAKRQREQPERVTSFEPGDGSFSTCERQPDGTWKEVKS